MTNRLIIVGSPRVHGKSAQLAEELFAAYIEEHPDDAVSLASIASMKVKPCVACDACKQGSRGKQESKVDEEAFDAEGTAGATDATDTAGAADDGFSSLHPFVAQSDASLHRCTLDDDMDEIRSLLDAADELIIVCPVYFAGAPAQFKCLLDRLQPYFYSNLRKIGKRQMRLHVIGDGGDPYGFDPLIGTLRSACAVAGFQIDTVFDWTGKIDAEGEIEGSPENYPIPPLARGNAGD